MGDYMGNSRAVIEPFVEPFKKPFVEPFEEPFISDFDITHERRNALARTCANELNQRLMVLKIFAIDAVLDGRFGRASTWLVRRADSGVFGDEAFR